MVQRKRVKKATRGYESRFFPNERDAKKCQDALYEYDNVVRGYETKWGIDRLPTLVEVELRDRFWAQLDLLNEAIAKGSGVEVEQAVRSTIRGCEALERRAVELGAEPVSGEVWEAVTPDGDVFALCKDREEIAKIRAEGRHGRVYCLEEVGVIIQGWEKSKAGAAVGKVKSLFDGAVIEEIKEKPINELLNDEIPF